MNNYEYDGAQQQLSQIKPFKEPQKVETLLRRLRTLRNKQTEISEKIKKASPRLAAVQYPEPLDLRGVQAQLQKDTLFLSYCVGKKVTQLFALLNDELSVFTIPVPRVELERDIRLYRSFLLNPTN
ncbi:hypothetical protein ACFL27_26765, partial [candidate division CSSED10-310 bacterium]